jgi:uncharacterized protein (DUF1501 family)
MQIDRTGCGRQTRRKILQRGAAGLLALGGLPVKAGSSALNSRVLVNLQLMGGNDSNNMIVPLDDAPYQRYQAGRGALAIPREQLLPITAPSLNGARFGFHPALVQLQDRYQRKALAVVANIGTIDPADASHLTNQLAYIKGGFNIPAWAAGMMGLTDRLAIEQHTFTFSSGVTMISNGSHTDGPRYHNRSLLKEMALARISTQFPPTPLGEVLKQVAQLVHAAPAVGASDPVIFCSKSGFETSRDQLNTQALLYAELDSALGAFARAMEDTGAAQRVTLFTQTEFNRTLAINASGGSGHAWGGHQLVMGHSVLGGDVHGRFPTLQIGGPEDAAGNGTWIPTTSNDQYHAALAGWLGVGLDRLDTVFPARSRSAAPLHFLI